MYVEDEESDSKDKEAPQAFVLQLEAEEPKSAERTPYPDSTLSSGRGQETPEADTAENSIKTQAPAEKTRACDDTIDAAAEKDQNNSANISQTQTETNKAQTLANKAQQVSTSTGCAVVTKIIVDES